MPRYRFSDFVLSPQRRTLRRGGADLPLIPRYFDLLVFLVERRDRAVHRRDIFDAVWTDVVVSDSALSQAIRTIRRALGDDPREPRFLRTVSRHGYQFVFVDVVEEEEDSREADAGPNGAQAAVLPEPSGDPFAPLLDLVTRAPANGADEDAQGDAAERLHALGTAEALARLGTRAGHARARALLRDARWESAGAGPVPIFSEPDSLRVVWHLVRLRMRRAASIAAARSAAASVGAGAAGALGGAVGGLLLLLSPGGGPLPVVPVLAAIGAGCGAVAGAGVGAGLSIAEPVMRSRRTLALTAFGGLGGGAVGLVIEMLTTWSLTVLTGMTPDIGGGVDGLLIGASAGLGYGSATVPALGGLAAPKGRARARTALLTAAACALAGLALSLAGRPLVGGTIHAVAQASGGSQGLLAPLGRLIGEPGFGPVTAAMIAMGESATFGAGLAFGLTHRR